VQFNIFQAVTGSLRVFGLRPSPSILGATIEHHLCLFQQSEPEIVEMLKDSLYVDDFITGEENDAKAFNVYKKSKEIMAKGGFNLRKWHSNSPNLLKLIETDETSLHEHSKSAPIVNTTEDDESYAKSQTTIGNFKEENDSTVKVLGLNWDTTSDEIFFDLSDDASELRLMESLLLELINLGECNNRDIHVIADLFTLHQKNRTNYNQKIKIHILCYKVYEFELEKNPFCPELPKMGSSLHWGLQVIKLSSDQLRNCPTENIKKLTERVIFIPRKSPSSFDDSSIG
ncbi:Hypothetical predicted protein, partial [Paramuricea clavata]